MSFQDIATFVKEKLPSAHPLSFDGRVLLLHEPTASPKQIFDLEIALRAHFQRPIEVLMEPKKDINVLRRLK